MLPASELSDRLLIFLQVQEMICAHLSNTQDVVNYMLLSRSTYDTIKRFAYRQIFLNHFDPLEPVVDEDMSYRCHLTYKLRVLCRKEPFCEFAKPKYSRTYSHMIRSVVLRESSVPYELVTCRILTVIQKPLVIGLTNI